MIKTPPPIISEDQAPAVSEPGSVRRSGAVQHTVLELGPVRRVALAVRPKTGNGAVEQTLEAIAAMHVVLEQQPVNMTVTMQTIFVRSAEDLPQIRSSVEEFYAARMPSTSYVIQPPCGGQALSIEAWAIGGAGVDICFPAAGMAVVEYNGLKWTYISDIQSPDDAPDAYGDTQHVFKRMATQLKSAEATFNDVPRVWLYQSGITEKEINREGDEVERYRDLNRSRTDFFEQLGELGEMSTLRDGRAHYPASTGIGMSGGSLTASCFALQADEKEIRLVPLENPNQTAALDYARHFSIKSPKFSRAMAVLVDGYATTWVSGTASILDSESVHLGDIEKQTEQTIDNIEALIGPDNFKRHGAEGTGALLSDLARVRVYVKHAEDYEKCRAVCRHRFGDVPITFVLADVCRTELLVEIEGVAFSKSKSGFKKRDSNHGS